VTFPSYFVCIHLKKQEANGLDFHNLPSGSAGLFPGLVEIVLCADNFTGFKGLPPMMPRSDFFNHKWLPADCSGLARYDEFMV
jgi:hypothetical protein